MKKTITYLLLATMLLNPSFCLSSYADEIIKNDGKAPQIQEAKEDNVIPGKLKKEIKNQIIKIYGADNADEIYNKVYEIAKKAKEERPETLLKEDLTRDSDWYKDEIIYTFYADQFGTKETNEPNKFEDTAKMLDYLSDLGVTTLHILPFADSPMNDAGFDVKNPKNVRADLGGMPQFKTFIVEAKKRGFKIKTDLVLNHFSDQHQWFQDLLKGDESKLDYFIVKEKMPEYRRYTDEKLGVVVEYKEESGKISKRRQIFPEISENNYRKITVNGKDYYVYHTFYPFQPDINWENPEVLYYCLGTINYWANLGVDIFRMDAIPYLSKEEGTNAENQPKTHAVLKLLSAYIQSVSPRSVIQAEACQTPKEVLPYFGTERKIHIANKLGQKEIKRTDEFQIAYHFPYMPGLWATLVTKDTKYFKDVDKATPSIPSSSAWAVFLRVHDELTLEMIDPSIREILYNSLVNKGVEFRQGFGVSGRMANFLDNNPQRIAMAFSILLSMPGIPIIYYGDEIGIRNNYTNALDSAKEREKIQKKNKIKLLSYFDSRDINRGAIAAKMFYGSSKDYYEYNSKIYRYVKELISIRKKCPALKRGTFTQLKTDKESVFAYIRKYKDERIFIINNLSNKRCATEVELPIDIVLKQGTNKIEFYDLIHEKSRDVKVSLVNRKITVYLKPYGYLWFRLEKEQTPQKIDTVPDLKTDAKSNSDKSSGIFNAEFLKSFFNNKKGQETE